jgi:hypothetical protein
LRQEFRGKCVLSGGQGHRAKNSRTGTRLLLCMAIFQQIMLVYPVCTPHP